MTAVRVADFIEARQIDDPAYQNAVEAADAADLAAVLALADHEDPDVRRDVASTLPLLTPGESPVTAMIEVAIRLTGDLDPRVRDFACFALGTQWDEIDTGPVREALAARLEDIDADTRYEALVGLARRQDRRALVRVKEALSRPSENLWRLEIVAAGMFVDPQLHELVLRHQTGWQDADGARAADVARRLTDPAGPGRTCWAVWPRCTGGAPTDDRSAGP
jgi:HEAT repeat protein